MTQFRQDAIEVINQAFPAFTGITDTAVEGARELAAVGGVVAINDSKAGANAWVDDANITATAGNIDITMQSVEAQFGMVHSHLQNGARVDLPLADRTLYIPGG